jgi:putative alpha-1,2-mannosidase
VRKLVIDAPENSRRNVYLRSITHNGKNITKNYITHNELLKGGKLLFEMTEQPNRMRGTGDKSYPFSMSLERKP